MGSAFVRRGLGVIAVIVILLGLCVWFGALAPAPTLGAYPDSDTVGQTPSAYVGSVVEISGRVVHTEPVVIELASRPDSRLLAVTDLTTPVVEGETLRVFGTMTGPGTVSATAAFTVPRSGFVYTYVVSFLAGLWVLSRLLGQWRFAPRAGFVRRAEPRSPAGRLHSRLRPAGDDEEVTDADA